MQSIRSTKQVAREYTCDYEPIDKTALKRDV